MADGPVDILITGGTGQVGLELTRASWPSRVRLHSPTRAELNLADIDAVRAAFAATPFKAVINSGAYTAVDRAETEVAAAFAANALGPAILAEVTAAAGIPLVQVSTDYVFDGLSDRAYAETDPVGPLGVYGASKLAGELAVRAGNPRSVVIRTAWVLSAHGSNFIKTMLRLAGERPVLRVVEDQFGCPTAAGDIAQALRTVALRMIDEPDAPVGVYHFVSAGSTTWADLAREVMRLSLARGGPSAAIEGITTAQYPTPARRPSNSRLDTFRITRDYGIAPRPWEDAVAEIVTALIPETTS